MSQVIRLQCHITPEQAGTYFTLPFELPEQVEWLRLRYRYLRYPQLQNAHAMGHFTNQTSVNTIDLGLLAPDGRQVCGTGSDKSEVFISALEATPGCRCQELKGGQWQVIVGAYRIGPEGVDVEYEIEYQTKSKRWLRGDLHTHTIASDGVHTAEELGWKAKRNGLDFVAITDHNQQVLPAQLPQVSGVTFIPGLEWTNYKAHVNFLGAAVEMQVPFHINTEDEAIQVFQEARQKGALICINHPMEEKEGFHFALEKFTFDCLEIWNGPMREANLKSVGLWHSWLCAGRKIPAVGGSDYHRDTPFIFLGGPTICVYALSASPQDILQAVRNGNSYITFAPEGPVLSMQAGEAGLGDSLRWNDQAKIEVKVSKLIAGDVMQLVSAQERQTVFTAQANGTYHAFHDVKQPGFVRLEVQRAFLPGLPHLPALISNPIYFD